MDRTSRACSPASGCPERRPPRSLALRDGLAVLAAGLFLQTAVADAGAALSLEAAQRAAQARSLALPAQEHSVRAARERAVAAAQRPDPVLHLGLDNVPVESGTASLLTREGMTARSIGISQALPDAAKRSARAQAFEREAEVGGARQEVERSILLRETALAWFALRAQQQRLALLEAQRIEAVLSEEAAEAAYRAGRGAQAEVFAARGALARIADQRLQMQSQAAESRSVLRRWVGDAAEATLAAPPPITRSMLGESAAAEHLARHPLLLQAAARESAARAGAGAAREDRRSDWSVDLRFAQRGPRYDNMVTIGFSLPLRWDLANRQDREVSARLAAAEQIAAETEELRRSQVAEIERWQQRWRAGLARLAGFDTDLLPLAETRTQAALAAYRAASGSLQTVLMARQDELQLRMERVQVELDTAADWARLQTLIPEPEATR